MVAMIDDADTAATELEGQVPQRHGELGQVCNILSSFVVCFT